MRARGIAKVACGLALAAAVLAGCGGSEQSESTKDDAPQREEARKRGFEGRQAATFADTKDFCRTEPRSEFAVEEGLPADSSIVVIARLYASQWPRNLRRAAFEGCVAGLAMVPARFPSSSPSARDIWGREFVATSVIGGGDGEEPPVVRPLQIKLSFGTEREHELGWSAGCNGYGGSVHFTATKMEVDDVVGTLMGCEAELLAQDEWLSRFMESDPEWRLEGEHLLLSSDRGRIELKG